MINCMMSMLSRIVFCKSPKSLKQSIYRVVFTMISIVWLFSCQSTPKTVVEGETTFSGVELKKVARQFSDNIANYFYRKGIQGSVFVALLSTKNDTTEDIPIDVLDFNLVNSLLATNILTVRTEDRGRAIDEIEFNLSGFSDSDLRLGRMKTPNYFIKVIIKENYLRRDEERISEFTVLMELRSVETQLVHASDIVQFTKHSSRTAKGFNW